MDPASPLTPQDGVLRADPAVIKTASGYRLYYGITKKTDLNDPQCPVDFARVATAASTDGVAFTIDDAIALDLGASGAWDDEGAETPSVLTGPSGELMMFYSGQGLVPNPGCADFQQCAFKLGLAQSPDGVSFSRVGAVPLFDVPTSTPSVFYAFSAADPGVVLVDGTYYMWFAGYSNDGSDDQLSIGVATSTDATNWKVIPDPVLTKGAPGTWDDEAVATPSVVYDGTQFVMAYTGVSERFGGEIAVESGSIGLAVSKDAVTWTRVGTGPIISKGDAGTWGDIGVWGPNLVLEGGNYRIYFAGVHLGSNCSERTASIGLARPSP